MTQRDPETPAVGSPVDRGVRPRCSHCGFPLPASDSGLRHYGTHTAHQEAECLRLMHAEIERLRTAWLNADGMAGCMDLLRNDLESMGVVPKGTAPMFMTEAIVRALQKAVADERERIAKHFDDRDKGLGIGFYDPHEPAEIIRALGPNFNSTADPAA